MQMVGRRKKHLSHVIMGTLIAMLLLPATHAAPPDSKNQVSNDKAPDELPNYRHGVLPPHHDDNLFLDLLKYSDSLHLSEKQIQAAEKLNRTYLNKIYPLQEKLNHKLKELHFALQKVEVDLSEVREKLEEISPYRIDILMLKIEHRLKVEKILTPSQKELVSNRYLNK